jgi:hypothetical protein
MPAPDLQRTFLVLEMLLVADVSQLQLKRAPAELGMSM